MLPNAPAFNIFIAVDIIWAGLWNNQSAGKQLMVVVGSKYFYADLIKGFSSLGLRQHIYGS